MSFGYDNDDFDGRSPFSFTNIDTLCIEDVELDEILFDLGCIPIDDYDDFQEDY